MKKLLLTSLFTLLFPALSCGASATLTWDANTESDLSHYTLYWGDISRGSFSSPDKFTYAYKQNVGNVTTYTITDIQDEYELYASLTASDFSGNESGFSNEAHKRIDTTAPAKPGDIIITITIVR